MFVNNIICTCFPPKERERDREKDLHHLYPTCWQALGKLPYNREKLSNVHCQNKENIYSYIENTVICTSASGQIKNSLSSTCAQCTCLNPKDPLCQMNYKKVDRKDQKSNDKSIYYLQYNTNNPHK